MRLGATSKLCHPACQLACHTTLGPATHNQTYLPDAQRDSRVPDLDSHLLRLAVHQHDGTVHLVRRGRGFEGASHHVMTWLMTTNKPQRGGSLQAYGTQPLPS